MKPFKSSIIKYCPESIVSMLRVLKRVVVGRTDEMLCYMYYYFTSNRNNVKIVIFAQGRTGSSVLENLICSTGDIKEYGEILNPKVLLAKFPLEFVIGKGRKSRSNLIVHIKPNHLKRLGKDSVYINKFLRRLSQDGWSIIHLRRENVVLHTLSRIYGLKAERWAAIHPTSDNFQVTIEWPFFLKLLNRRAELCRMEEEGLAGIKCIDIEYQRDIFNSNKHQATANRIFNYIGLKGGKVSTYYHRSHTRQIHDYVINFDEFVMLLKENGLDEYLNDEGFRILGDGELR